ncbi:MAG: DNA helicase RecQ [Planctomycetia bacterium]|nr:DNA helicase RecQ [Planctomycetia bacterium]
MEQALEILRTTFGYDEFRHNQADVIQTLLEGKDALALMPTGGGKSLCYQIPAICRPGTGIIISPLIALMQDQVDALKQLGIACAFINSTLDRESQRAIEAALLNNELDLLYIAPERLLNEYTLSLLERCQIALFAIDEAHCVSQWGHDFRPEYQRLSLLHQRFGDVPRIALTATADEVTRDEIKSQLDLHQARTFISSFDRKNICYQIVEGQNGRDQLLQFIEKEHAHDSGIVYCLSRKKVEKTSEWLVAQGRTALPYHAGLSNSIRQQHQQRFLREEEIIIVATIAFGMGIDKPDVRFVAHLSLPKSIEAYYQETGRAGRDDLPANTWMNYGLQDVISLRQMVLSSEASDTYKRVSMQKLEAMLGLCESTLCRRQTLLAYFGESLDEPCGNCDNCLTPPELWDASKAAQMALSCVYRSGQRFGVNYLVNILRGKTDERILANGHDALSTFGIGADDSVQHWRVLYRQLIALGYLEVDPEGYGALRLTEKCRPLLRGETSLNLRRQRVADKKTSKRKRRQNAEVMDEDQPLFSDLRNLRKEFADAQGVPPYVIFHDTTLAAIAQHRPEDKTSLLDIPGIGQHKLDNYGERVIEVVREHILSL